MKIKLIISIVFVLFQLQVFASFPVTVYGANNIADGTGYATLKGAFDAINATINQSGRDIEIRIGSSFTETATASLSNNNWKSLVIYPTESGIIIDANMGSAIVRLHGAKNVTIDGRINRAGSEVSLTIINNSAFGGAVAIDLLNSAQNNILQYTKFQGQLADNSRGVVFIGSSTSGDGNNNNIIRFNEISGISENQRPRHAIASNGTSGRENKNNQILNNKIFNFLNKYANANGLTLISGSENFIISGNSFYETVEDFAPQGGYNYYAIRTNINSVHTITNNFIGGNAPENSGTWKTVKGETDAHHSFTAIYVAGKVDESSLVEGNIIKNFHMITGGAPTNHDTWDGIFIQDGNVDVLNNTIGAITGTGLIYVEATHGSTFATTHGILNNSTGTVNIKNNTMGSIEIKGAPNYSHSFEGIYLRARTNITIITDNLIGSTSTTNSINVSGTANTSSFKQDNYGIYSASQNEVYIRRNTIVNIHNAYIGTISTSRTRGIRVLAGSNYIENNLIYEISSSSNQAAGINSSASVIGIDVTANTEGTTQSIIGNIIYNLNANNAEATAVAAFGIYFSGPTNSSRNIIEGNFVYNIRASSSSNNSLIIGVLLHRGNNVVFNNIISLGVNISRGYRIFGIWDDSGSTNNNNIYFNTVYLGGNVTIGSATSVSTAIWNQNNTSTRNYRNNIFANQRLVNGSGSNDLYAIRLGGMTNVTINYNNYWSNGNRIGRVASGPLRVALHQWRIATSQDVNSLEVDPVFQNISGNFNIAQDFITDITVGNLLGIVISGIDNDYDDLQRLDPPKMGAFENNNYIWYGTVSTDFNDARNWAASGIGIVPTNGADVRFANTPANSCFLDQERSLRNIIINSTNSNNYFVLNGKTLILTGELSFTNNAKLDAKATGSVLVLKGTTPQSLALGTILDNEFAGLAIDNELGFTQNTDYLVKESFALTIGAYSLGANTITINGSVTQTAGTLIGGATSNIVFGGSGAATILPSVELNDLTIHRANGINMAGNVSVGGTLSLTSGTLTLGGNRLEISGNSPTGTGNINASNSSAELVFSNSSPITLLSTFFGGNAVNDLTISGMGGIAARGDFTVNGVMNLQTANPSPIKGSIDMIDGSDLKILTMGATATTIGQGDVTGKVKRTSIAANTIYTFGSQYSTITFTGGTGDQLPSDLTFIIKIGEVPPNGIKDDAVKRYYEIIRTGGSSPTRFNLNLRYLDSELNGNEQSKMVFWDHHVPYNGLSPHEHGVSFHNTMENYMVLASHGIGYLVKNEYTGEISYIDDDETPQNQSKIWLFAERVTASGPDIFVWIGPGGNPNPNSWDENNNWADNCSPKNAAEGNCGSALDYEYHRVFIQDAPNKPTIDIPLNLIVRSLYIEQGADFDAPNTITVHGALDDDNGYVSWSNQGNFGAGASNVIFKSNNAVIAGNTDFYDLEIESEAKLSMINGSRIGIENELEMNSTGVLNTTFYGNTTVEYNGAAQTVINPENNEYSTLILSGSGTKTLPTELTKILGDFKIIETASTTGTFSLSIDINLHIATGAIFTTGVFDHSLKGNFENNGTFIAASGHTFTFNGALTQYITGVAKSSFDVFELNNSNGLTLLSDVDINNELKLTSGIINVTDNTLGINGTISGQSASDKINVSNLSSLSFGGSGAFSIPNDLFVNSPTIDNLTINRSGGVNIGNQDFTINGDLALLDGNLIVGSSTLGINGTTSGTSKIELSNSSSLSFGGTEQFIIPNDYFAGTTAIENFTMNRTNGVVLGNQTFTIYGVLDLERGELGAEGKTIHIVGNIVGNTGSLGTSATTILNFTENLATDPAIFLPSALFSNNILGTLLVNRTNGFNLGNQDIVISDDLVLEKGIINGNTNLIIFNNGASFSTSSSESLPADENRYINGCVRKIGKTAFIFPIGDIDEFAPIAISDAEGGGYESEYFTACYYSYDPSIDLYFSNQVEQPLHHVSSSEYWTLKRNEDGTNNVKVTLSWAERSGPIVSTASLRVSKWNGEKWIDKGNNGIVGDFDEGVITSELVQDFSPFTIGSTTSDNILPVSLLYFSSECQDGKILIEWATASEVNNDYFEILVSKNGLNWESLVIINGAGNSNSTNYYSYLHIAVNENKYYKLLQFDYDGTVTEYFPVYTNCNLKNYNMILFPNPTNDYINLLIDDDRFKSQFFIIQNSLGLTVKHGILEQGHNKIPVIELNSGLYLFAIPQKGLYLKFHKL